MIKYTPEQITVIWGRFFENYSYLILSIADNFPDIKYFEIDYWDIDKYDSDFAGYLLDKPYNSINNAEQEILNHIPPDILEKHKGFGIKIRIRNLPDYNNIKVSKLRAEHLGKLVALEGVIRKTTEVRPKLTEGVYQCLRCYGILKVPQVSGFETEPLECSKEQGGCGRAASSTAFKLLTEKSIFMDNQIVEIMETPEGLGMGGQPESIAVHLIEDLTGILKPGDRVTINGILRSRQRVRRGMKMTVFDILIEGNSIEMKERGYEDIKISDDEEKEIIKISKDGDLDNILIGSFAPTIYGMDIEKEVLILQLAGGVTKIMPDDTMIRGNIHVQLIGDPGTAKSQLILASHKTAPLSVLVSGKQATSAGITATVVRDIDFGGGRWVLEPGAMVMADNGHFCLDEIDKLTKEAQESLHEGLEQQEIHLSKASITASLNARCSLLAGANPKYGRFDEYKPIADQINMKPALLSRFDVILLITDRPDKIKDRELSAHILRAHRAGEMVESDEYDNEEKVEAMKPFKKRLSRRFLRKYIAYARRNFRPVMNEESMQALQDFYVNLRMEGAGENTISITVRQLEGLIRLAEASAKLRLSNKIENQDINKVVRICEYFLKRVASDSGILDIDSIMTGVAHSQRGRFIQLMDSLKNLDTAEGVKDEDIKEYLKPRSYDMEMIDSDLQKLKKEGRIFQPRDGIWKVV